ncbi:MAG: M1 family aminopeptidase, partial [Bacteroidota bacterium]
AFYRDYSSKMYTVLYAYPLRKRDYLAGKFLAAFLIIFLVVATIGLGFALGAAMPGIEAGVVVPFSLGPYLQLYGLFIGPNMLLFTVIVSAIVLSSRNVYVGFISIILLVVGQNLVGSLFAGGELAWVAALLDPIGDTAVKQTVRFWTLDEKNTLALPLRGPILWNRVLWFGIGMLLAGYAYRKFSFQQFVARSSGKSSLPKAGPSPIAPTPLARDYAFSPPPLGFAWSDRLRTAWALSNSDFRHIVFSWPFLAILFGGALMVFFQQAEMNPQYGFVLLPTTARMLRVPMFVFSLVINLLTFLYAGVLMYRGQQTGMYTIIDSSPQPNWVLLLSRLWAIWKMQLLLLGLVMLCGIGAQVVQGYFRFQLGHYLFELLGLHFVHFAIWACVAIFVHSLFNNLYLGLMVLLLLPIGFMALPMVGDQLGIPLLKESILQFNAVPGVAIGFDYSDLFGYTPILAVYAAFKTYWAMAALLLLLVALLFWKRGFTFSWSERMGLLPLASPWRVIWGGAPSNESGALATLKFPIFITLFAFISLGATLFYQEHFVPNTYISAADAERFSLLNEQDFGQWERLPQPQLRVADINMNLYPTSRDFRAKGRLSFVNTLDQRMDTIIIATSPKEATTINPVNAHRWLKRNAEVYTNVLVLEQPLEKGDTFILDFTLANIPNSLLHNNSRVLTNGTYLTKNILPQLGVRNAFLSDPVKRAKYGLGERQVAPKHPSDTTLLNDTYLRNDMGRIHFRTTVSTSTGQRAFSLGTLKKQWQADDRQYFEYASDGLIKNDIAWLSGDYQRHEQTFGHHSFELYHHPQHDHNFAHVLAGSEAALRHYSAWFGPLVHDTLRLIEFPMTTGTHVTLNGNLIPYSEALFLCNPDGQANDVFNVPFFISAHELAHYWWGHRVDPANVPGGKAITEAMADFLAIKVVEKEFGKPRALDILRRMQSIYLEQRANAGKETPLKVAPLDAEYLNYRKGAQALYALNEYLGENVLLDALARFERQHRFAPPPYPTSIDFIEAIRAVTADSLQYLVHDYFETITLYDNTLQNVTIEPQADGQYALTLDFTVSKYRADKIGAKSYTDAQGNSLQHQGIHSLPLQDFVRIGFFRADEDSPFTKRQYKVERIANQLRLTLPERPDRVVIDPEHLLIDVERQDNVWSR